MEKKSKKRKTFTRRDFLKGFGGGALGAAVVPKYLPPAPAVLQTKEGKIPHYSRKQITITVNQKNYSLEVEPRETLLQVLRERLNLTGTKMTCDRGECGDCTVLLDGIPVYSCLTLALRTDGAKITTIEGLADKEKLHPIQQAFIDKDAYQCGFCTPGFIISSVALLKGNKNPDLEEIKSGLAGNICRCGNYSNIYEAVSAASKRMGSS
ncbi:MAG: 2Fe-2S iron-sulfur cluster binding domain-containing protein [Candidatus Aminicenantes bacterium]|nr:2Fe-2S iron-sulfur cluster binding domain-containing protein [Candidatus Aminicenantes bacterium]